MKLSSDLKEKLIQTAQKARHWAYAPYSKYLVGAAVLTASGKIYDGVNVENAAYPSGVCAERVAVYKAVSEGERQIVAVAVVTANAGTPCGFCRQVLNEFSLDMIVLVADEKLGKVEEWSLKDLLPGAFGPSDLPI